MSSSQPSATLDYATRKAHLEQQCSRLASQFVAAKTELAALQQRLDNGEKMTKGMEEQIKDARKRANTAADKHERAIAKFYLDAEKENRAEAEKVRESLGRMEGR